MADNCAFNASLKHISCGEKLYSLSVLFLFQWQAAANGQYVSVSKGDPVNCDVKCSVKNVTALYCS